MSELSYNELDKYLELYNIKYFLVFTREAKIYFNKNPEFRRVFRSNAYAMFEYANSDEKFCYRCDADITAGYDQIIVKNATSPGNSIQISLY